jgi:hypothetical protein
MVCKVARIFQLLSVDVRKLNSFQNGLMTFLSLHNIAAVYLEEKY